jgi:hypothetical protein
MVGLRLRSGRRRTIGLSTLIAAVLAGATVALVVHPTSASPASLSAADRTLLYRAEQTAIQNCLRDKGFRYWPQPQPSASVADRFPYVIDDVAWARVNGFGGRQAIQDQSSAARDPNARYVAGLSPTRRTALGVAENGNGPSDPGVIATLPTGQVVGHSVLGCDATAEGYLYGSFPAWFDAENAVGSLPSLWQAQVVADPRYTADVSRWARCMAARDEPYSSPQAAADRFATAGTAPESDAAFATEVSAALTEAECARSTGLGTLAAQLDACYRSQVDTEYAGLLSTYHRMQQEALPRARSLMHVPESSGRGKEQG